MSDLDEAARLAALAGLAGGVTRVLVALHGGVRRVPLLVLEAALGASLGIMAAAGCVYFDANLRHGDWSFLIVPGAAGAAGVIGIRLLDLVVAWLGKRLG